VLLRGRSERWRVNTRRGGLGILGPGRVKTEDQAKTLDEREGRKRIEERRTVGRGGVLV